MDELQLQLLKNMDAADPDCLSLVFRRRGPTDADLPAVEVQQKARPAIHDVPTVPATPAKGRENKRPMVDVR